MQRSTLTGRDDLIGLLFGLFIRMCEVRSQSSNYNWECAYIPLKVLYDGLLKNKDGFWNIFIYQLEFMHQLEAWTYWARYIMRTDEDCGYMRDASIQRMCSVLLLNTAKNILLNWFLTLLKGPYWQEHLGNVYKVQGRGYMHFQVPGRLSRPHQVLEWAAVWRVIYLQTVYEATMIPVCNK